MIFFVLNRLFFSAGRRSNPMSLAAGSALGEAVWVGRNVKKTAGSCF